MTEINLRRMDEMTKLQDRLDKFLQDPINFLITLISILPLSAGIISLVIAHYLYADILNDILVSIVPLTTFAALHIIRWRATK